MTEPIAAGRDADVFALDDHRVLRRYRRDADVAREATIMAHVGRHGYPVPEIFEAHGADLIMERIDGPTMARALVDGELGIADAAAMIADLLARLHELPPPAGAEAGTVVVHLDLHPENVMVTDAGPKVIDWCNATTGPADLDTALSALIVAQVAIGSIDHPIGTAAGEFVDRFVALAPGNPTRLLDRALAIRLGNRTMSPEELAALPTAAARVRAAADANHRRDND